MATAVHAWLTADGDFDEGIALLKAHGHPGSGLLFVLELGETTVARRQLREALEAIREAAIERTIEVNAASPARTAITKADIRRERDQLVRDPRSDGYEGVTLPAALRDVRDGIPALLREMNYLRYGLEKLPDDNDRLRDVRRIVVLDAQIVSAYHRLDTWKETGTDPGDVPAEPSKGGAQLQRELTNLITYLSRHRSGARPANPQRVKEWEKRVQDIKDLIDAVPT